MKTKLLPISDVVLAQRSKKQMKYFTAGLLLLLAATVYSQEMPIVSMQTNLGMIVLELHPDKAPKTVANFLRYTQEGFYNGTIFHRVVRRFVIQGGGYTIDYEKKPPTYPPIPNESQNGLKNRRGTIAMARRTDELNSATSQFFINVNNNESLNYSASSYSYEGYTVFGKVIKGMEVVDKIQNIETGSQGPLRRYVPQQMVLIEKVTVENLPITKDQSSPTLITPPAETQEESIAITEIQEETDSPLATKTPENISTTAASESQTDFTETKPQSDTDIENFSTATTDTEEEPFSQSIKETESSSTTSTDQTLSSTEATAEETSSASEIDTDSGIFSLFTGEIEEETSSFSATDDTQPETLFPLATETQENISVIDRETETVEPETLVSPDTSVASLAAEKETDTDSTEAIVEETETERLSVAKIETPQASEAAAQESKILLFPPDSPSQSDKPEALPD